MNRIALVMFDTEKTSYSGVHQGERGIALLFVLYHLSAKMHQINIISDALNGRMHFRELQSTAIDCREVESAHTVWRDV